MLVISSRISGWRVTASITFPKMIPMPTPAPRAPRPPPIPIPRPALTPAAICKMGKSTSSSFGLVVGDRATEVDRGQRGEDECLKRGHEAQLEQVDQDPERQREPPKPTRAEDHGEPPGHEQDDQVASEDVREQSHRQRYQAHVRRDHF